MGLIVFNSYHSQSSLRKEILLTLWRLPVLARDISMDQGRMVNSEHFLISQFTIFNKICTVAIQKISSLIFLIKMIFLSNELNVVQNVGRIDQGDIHFSLEVSLGKSCLISDCI